MSKNPTSAVIMQSKHDTYIKLLRQYLEDGVPFYQAKKKAISEMMAFGIIKKEDEIWDE